VKSRRDHVTTTTTGGIGVLDTGDGGVVITILFVSVDVIKRRRVQSNKKKFCFQFQSTPDFAKLHIFYILYAISFCQKFKFIFV